MSAKKRYISDHFCPKTSIAKAPTHKKQKHEPFETICDGSERYESAFLLYEPHALDDAAARAMLADLKARHAFTQDEIVVFNRRCLIPRKQALLSSDAGVAYRYSGCTTVSQRWSDDVGALCAALSRRFNVPLNSCLVNWYRDGNDRVGAHADDEDDMAHDVVVTMSLGAPRFLRVTRGAAKVLQINLQHGSVFVQKSGMQRTHKHEIPRQATIKDERISLTFRQLKTR